ncbi:hypothetical protein B0T22DRAFT_531238 [Podospora appendiculata]|uniref:Integral membrane protein n=1 Tax=Podospora appendiculata TaxID=314037 RepID=A0AAE1C7E0_9PEZI|nr:hypothetical protein B0T22DRAFT_531238 [Podospora appendiculata]
MLAMHPSMDMVLGFSIIYFLLVVYLRSRCWKDPTSKFFQTQPAHIPTYSAHRIQQSLQYADSLNTSRPSQGRRRQPPELCVGVPSVQRDGISYLKPTLGSLQHGLSEDERAGLHFVVLLAHLDQKEHQDFGQPWLQSMADGLPSYADDAGRLHLAQIMQHNQTHGTKSKFDYSIVMEECTKTGAPYILMVEDDVVFLDGWRHRTMDALDDAAAKSRETKGAGFLYLRLFYYEGLLGWNAQSWPRYLGASLATAASVLCVLLLTRRLVPTARLHLTRSALLLITLVFTPLLILLFFAAGANCVLPRPAGVHLMPENACCGQGLVFPRATVTEKLLPYFRANIWSEVPTDSFVEAYADQTGGLRWALTPVVMQHIGGKSSHGAARSRDSYVYGDLTLTPPSVIWNFAFEGNEARALGEEKERLVEGSR